MTNGTNANITMDPTPSELYQTSAGGPLGNPEPKIFPDTQKSQLRGGILLDRDGDPLKNVKYNPAIGKKYDQDKPDWSLIDLGIIGQIVEVLTFGKAKYGKDNWRHLENAEDRYFAAMLRHLSARQNGEFKDPESGLPHLAHAACCLFFMMWFDKNRTES